MERKRVAIIGTAQSWKRTPWKDDSLERWGLNDAYQLPGWGQCSRWYDLHPLNKFFMPELHVPGFTERNPRQIFAHELPPGHYVRPAHHLDWLSKQTIPVVLSRPEDHKPAEDYALPTWKHMRLFPKREIEARFGMYEASTPAWMLLQAVMEGFTEIHVYGIHLATEFEYVSQRPNFEAILGAFLGLGWKETVKDGLRRYESERSVLVLPVESPIFQAKYQYAFQPKPDANVAPLQWELHKVTVKRQKHAQAMQRLPWWKRKAALEDEALRLDVLSQDYQQQIARRQFAASLKD